MLAVNRFCGFNAYQGLRPLPTIEFDFMRATLPPGLTATRASAGSYIGSNGLLQSASTDVPRFEYDSSGTLLGMLVEGSRTNVVLHCRDLTNAAWTKSNTTTAKDQIGIDGVSNSASSLTATSDNGTCLQAITLASSARFQSAYVKRITGSGTVEMTMDNGSTWTAVTVTASWSRVNIAAQTLANPTVGFRMATSGDVIAIDFVQNENAALGNVYTSPIETTTVAVTRAADIVTASDFSWFNATEGAFFCEYKAPPVLFATGVIFAVSDNTFNECMYYSVNATATGISIVDGGSGQAGSVGTKNVSASETIRMASRYKANDAISAITGTLQTQDSSITLPTVDRMYLGSNWSGNNNFLNSHLRKLSYWNQILANWRLQELSRV